MKVRELVDGDNENYTWRHARWTSCRNGSIVKTLEPERRGYKASRQPTSEVAIWRRLNEDVYLNFAGSARARIRRSFRHTYSRW
jgi:cytochrome c biogenesis factor